VIGCGKKLRREKGRTSVRRERSEKLSRFDVLIDIKEEEEKYRRNKF
jgi:hypothetical protein